MIAAAGEISATEWQELKVHLAECESCRSVFGDMEEIHALCTSDGTDSETLRDPKSTLALRKKILRDLAREGVRFSKAASKQRGGLHLLPGRDHPSLPWTLLRPGVAFAAGVVIALAAAGSGLILHQRASRENIDKDLLRMTMQNSILQSSSPQPSDSSSYEGFRESAARQAKFETDLGRAQAERARLMGKLEEMRSRVAHFEEVDATATQRIAQLEQQLAATTANESRVQAELAALRDARAVTETALAAKERDVRDLAAKLEDQSATVERETQLLAAGREIRDVVAARNLHIIDVYDTDGQGKTKKAFGRVFYTEGKSLLFYAYDLPAHRMENAKYSFYAWGKRDGNEQPVRSLGLLYNDDQTQKRWVLNITDPHVLAQIDSVFITLERTDNPSNRPSGKQILSAYLHSPANHP